LAPEVEALYGPARLVVVFTVSGAAGFLLSSFLGVPFFVGASGALFWLLGALGACGRRRGGAFWRRNLQQYGLLGLILFISGFLMSGVDNRAHAGGFIGGFVSGLALSMAERRAETTVDWLLASAAIVLTVIGFGLALFTAFAS